MCHLNWAMGCSDVKLKVILGVSVNAFPDEIHFWIGRLYKADCLPQYGWSLSNPLKAWIEQNAKQERIALSAW